MNKFKIDTKEKFTVITPVLDVVNDNIAADLWEACTKYLEQLPRNVVLNLSAVKTLEINAAGELASLQQRFYDNKASFVLCEVNETIKKTLNQEDLLDILNITPTESEAWDMVQMEEIEREYDIDDSTQENLNG